MTCPTSTSFVIYSWEHSWKNTGVNKWHCLSWQRWWKYSIKSVYWQDIFNNDRGISSHYNTWRPILGLTYVKTAYFPIWMPDSDWSTTIFFINFTSPLKNYTVATPQFKIYLLDVALLRVQCYIAHGNGLKWLHFGTIYVKHWVKSWAQQFRWTRYVS